MAQSDYADDAMMPWDIYDLSGLYSPEELFSIDEIIRTALLYTDNPDIESRLVQKTSRTTPLWIFNGEVGVIWHPGIYAGGRSPYLRTWQVEVARRKLNNLHFVISEFPTEIGELNTRNGEYWMGKLDFTPYYTAVLADADRLKQLYQQSILTTQDLYALQRMRLSWAEVEDDNPLVALKKLLDPLIARPGEAERHLRKYRKERHDHTEF